jgi:TonB family protein
MNRNYCFERRLRALLHRFTAGAPAVRVATLLIALAGLGLAAATDGVLQGVVSDPNGGVVAGARVFVAFPDLRRKEVIETNSMGEFSLTPLAAGEYSIEVQKAGFAALRQAGIVVKAGEPARLELRLKVGEVRETMTVAGEAAGATGASTGSRTPRRIAVGGNVQQAMLQNMARPAYPEDCKADHVQGTVLLRAVIGREGDVIGLEQINQLVDGRLAEAAMLAVKQWKYKPTLLNGEPVQVQTEITVNFELRQ